MKTRIIMSFLVFLFYSIRDSNQAQVRVTQIPTLFISVAIRDFADIKPGAIFQKMFLPTLGIEPQTLEAPIFYHNY